MCISKYLYLNFFFTVGTIAAKAQIPNKTILSQAKAQVPPPSAEGIQAVLHDGLAWNLPPGFIGLSAKTI